MIFLFIYTTDQTDLRWVIIGKAPPHRQEAGPSKQLVDMIQPVLREGVLPPWTGVTKTTTFSGLVSIGRDEPNYGPVSPPPPRKRSPFFLLLPYSSEFSFCSYVRDSICGAVSPPLVLFLWMGCRLRGRCLPPPCVRKGSMLVPPCFYLKPI